MWGIIASAAGVFIGTILGRILIDCVIEKRTNKK